VDEIPHRATDTFDPTKVVSPDDYLRLYKSAPFVMGEWPPTLLASEKLSDGRTFIRMLRRIEETHYLDADKPVPVEVSMPATRVATWPRWRNDAANFACVAP